MHNAHLNENETKPQRVDRIHFIPQIKVDCEGDYSADEIMDTLNVYNICFFPNGWFLSNEIANKIGKYPQIYDSDFDIDERDDFPLYDLLDDIRDDIMTERDGVYYPFYNIYGNEYTEDQLKAMEKVYNLTKELEVA